MFSNFTNHLHAISIYSYLEEGEYQLQFAVWNFVTNWFFLIAKHSSSWQEGEEIIIDGEQGDWYRGLLRTTPDIRGIFPKAYVTVVGSVNPSMTKPSLPADRHRSPSQQPPPPSRPKQTGEFTMGSHLHDFPPKMPPHRLHRQASDPPQSRPPPPPPTLNQSYSTSTNHPRQFHKPPSDWGSSLPMSSSTRTYAKDHLMDIGSTVGFFFFSCDSFLSYDLFYPNFFDRSRTNPPSFATLDKEGEFRDEYGFWDFIILLFDNFNFL